MPASPLNLMKRGGSDDFDTTLKGFVDVARFVPQNIRICDPFFNEGKAEKYMKTAFPTCTVVHTEADAFESQIDADLILTNPPYSIKFKVLEWLVGTGIPFCALLPIGILATKAFRKVPCYRDFQYIVPNGRVAFEREGYKLSAWFVTVWVCHGMDLPNQLNFL
jgi:hypothetical protein